MPEKPTYQQLEEKIQALELSEAGLKRTEKKLRESETLFRTLFETAVDAIFIKDKNLKYRMVNPAMGRHFGKNSEDLIGKTNTYLFGKKISDKVHHVDYRVLKGETIQEFANRPIEGQTRSLHIIKVPLKNSEGKITGLCGIVRDITELKQAEEEKLNAERYLGEQKKHALVGQIAGKIAHDFNNILGVIMGSAELSLFECEDAGTREVLKLIFDQTVRGKNLTRNLVAFAKDQEPKHESFKIKDKIDLVVNLMKRDLAGIELIIEDGPNVPELIADPGMIEHAMVNIIQNSIHALGKVERPKITIRISACSDSICLEIEDNGCGIPQSHMKRIYEPSFTLKGIKDVTDSYKHSVKGSGYGMSNTRKYIEQHKGSIRVESEFASGTKLTIHLPVIKKELTQDEKTVIIKTLSHVGKKVLLVEDEITISDIQFKVLTSDPCNHKVDIAYNGQTAINLFNSNEYDIISLDYILPGDINGMNIYNHIRKTNKTIPILFISGNIEFLESIKALKQKDSHIDHLSKPCQNTDYIGCLNRLMAKTAIEFFQSS